MIKKILIIDDEVLNRETTMLLLQRRGFDVTTAASGTDGLKTIASWQPDLLLLDIMMPEMDGWEVLRQIRNDTAMSHTTVIIFTALDENSSDEELGKRGANGLIRKPFNLKELLKVIDKCNREAANE